MDDNFAELNVTVLEQTKTFLDDMKENTGLTYGQIFDRIILQTCPSEPEFAALTILDYIIITTRNLNPKGFNQALFEVLRILDESSQEDNDPKYIRTTIQGLLDRFKVPNETGETGEKAAE